MTFGAHKLVHSEPFLDYLYKVWQLLSALYNVMQKKFIQLHIYVLVPKLLQWNFLQISQLSIRSGVHMLFRQFLDFSQFLTANFTTIMAPPNENEKYVVHLKEQSIPKKGWKPHQNWPINRHTILVWPMSPMHRKTKSDIQKTSIFAPTASVRNSIFPRLCTLIENVVIILKGGIIFRSNA